MEPDTHSFIIKLWREEAGDETSRGTWRGHITHVPSGARRYLEDLGEIRRFIGPYLEGMGVEVGLRERLRQWIRRWFLRKG